MEGDDNYQVGIWQLIDGHMGAQGVHAYMEHLLHTPRSCTQPPAHCPLPGRPHPAARPLPPAHLPAACFGQGEHFDDDSDYGDGGDEGPVC